MTAHAKAGAQTDAGHHLSLIAGSPAGRDRMLEVLGVRLIDLRCLEQSKPAPAHRDIYPHDSLDVLDYIDILEASAEFKGSQLHSLASADNAKAKHPTETETLASICAAIAG